MSRLKAGEKLPPGQRVLTRLNPKKLTPTVVRQLLAWIKQGATIKDACDASGISTDTLREWRRLGREQPDSVYGEFLEQYEITTARAKIKIINAIYKNKEWRSKAHWLAHRYPQEWGELPKEFNVNTTQTERPYKHLSEPELNDLIAQADAAEAAARQAVTDALLGTDEAEAGGGPAGTGAA